MHTCFVYKAVSSVLMAALVPVAATLMAALMAVLMAALMAALAYAKCHPYPRSTTQRNRRCIGLSESYICYVDMCPFVCVGVSILFLFCTHSVLIPYSFRTHSVLIPYLFCDHSKFRGSWTAGPTPCLTSAPQADQKTGRGRDHGRPPGLGRGGHKWNERGGGGRVARNLEGSRM